MLHENPKIVSEQEWLRALLTRNTGTGMWALFDAVEDGSLAKASSSESYLISEQVAERFKQDESLFEQARSRYRGDGSSSDRLLELCLSKSGRPECITAIINSYVKRGQRRLSDHRSPSARVDRKLSAFKYREHCSSVARSL
jgi:hypothetical protein